MVALPDHLLRDARHLAVDRGLSLSGLVAALLEERVESQRRYSVAREQSLRIMREGFPLGLGENVSWTRDQLHDR